MILNRVDLLSKLTASQCPYQLYEHPAVFTAEEATKYCAHVPGQHVKNLFLRNRKKTAYWLVTVKDEKRVDLSALGNQLNEGRLSFVNQDHLVEMLGVQPGSVTPLAIINDRAKRVTLIFDHDLLSEEKISVHPMENTATISMKFEDLLRFIENNHEGKIEFVRIPEM